MRRETSPSARSRPAETTRESAGRALALEYGQEPSFLVTIPFRRPKLAGLGFSMVRRLCAALLIMIAGILVGGCSASNSSDSGSAGPAVASNPWDASAADAATPSGWAWDGATALPFH